MNNERPLEKPDELISEKEFDTIVPQILFQISTHQVFQVDAHYSWS